MERGPPSWAPSCPVRLPPLQGPPLRCPPGSQLHPPLPPPLCQRVPLGAEVQGPQCRGGVHRPGTGHRAGGFCTELWGPAAPLPVLRQTRGCPADPQRGAVQAWPSLTWVLLPFPPPPGHLWPSPTHGHRAVVGSGGHQGCAGDDVALLQVLLLGGGEGGSRIRKRRGSGRVRPGARDPDFTVQPRSSRPQAALATAGGLWADRPSGTLPTFPRKASGCCGEGALPGEEPAGRTSGRLWQVTSTLGGEQGHPRGSAWPVPLGTEGPGCGQGTNGAGAARSTPGGWPVRGGLGNAGGRAGQAQLTSWEISRCFLAKVRACTGLPMDT